MSVYGAVANGVRVSQGFQAEWFSTALENANAIPQNPSAADLQKRQILIIKANQELSYANDVLNYILKNIRDLQP